MCHRRAVILHPSKHPPCTFDQWASSIAIAGYLLRNTMRHHEPKHAFPFFHTNPKRKIVGSPTPPPGNVLASKSHRLVEEATKLTQAHINPSTAPSNAYTYLPLKHPPYSSARSSARSSASNNHKTASPTAARLQSQLAIEKSAAEDLRMNERAMLPAKASERDQSASR
jgi:hypothetical protein